LSRISAKHKKDWEQLIRTSFNEEIMKDLENLRSNGVYHYYNIRGIFDGFMNHFKNPKEWFEKSAFYSFSPAQNILLTRFYFADAAAIGYAKRFGDKEIKYFLNEMNNSIKRIVKAGIEYFQERVST
jgi:hypothetical protein